ncbi:hypothetical protein ACTU3I_13150 [Microbacterium sp. RD1]|uniref:hypothetical protein n=1 Tax=Microbacterium sp. RD1 TaxID=3457313 RepID=UPI003FA54A5A
MTVWDVFVAFRRRWYVVVAGVLATAGVLAFIQVQEPVYFSRAQVYFLAPSSTLNPNVLRVASLDLVTAAGVVGKRVNGTDTMTRTADSQVTLVGRGIREGSSVQLPDNGGQWSVSYNRQELDVQVAAPTIAAVRREQERLFTRIDAELDRLQTDLNVPESNLITTEVVPSQPLVVEMSGERRRAQAMTLALGAALTMLAVGSIELHARRPKAAKRAAR